MQSNLLDLQQFSMCKIIGVALNASIGSFLFGYNIGIFNSMHNNVAARLDWGENKNSYVTLIATLMPLGALFGAICGGSIATKIGRRRALIFTDILVIMGSVIFLAPFTYTLAIGRVVTGYASGSFSVICPIYVSESAPPQISGKIGSLIQIMITLGIVFAYAIALPLPTRDYNSDPFNNWWIFMLSFQGVIAFFHIFIFIAVYHHETPFWLLENSRSKEALASLEQIYTKDAADYVLKDMETKRNIKLRGSKTGQLGPSYLELLTFSSEYSKKMRLGIMLNFFQQWCGINAIQNYSTSIFGSFGGGDFMARLLTLITKTISMIGTLSVFFIVDKFGRKPFLWLGNIGMAACLFLMSLFSGVVDAGVAPPLVCIMLFLMFFEISAGPITWVYCGEILGAKAMSICVALNWLFGLTVVFLFPLIVNGLGMSIAFFIYGGVCALAVFYTSTDVIETKGKTKLEIHDMLAKYS